MPTYKDITVVAIDGNHNIANAIPSVIHSAKVLPGAKKLLITNKIIDTNIPQKLIYQDLDYFGYSDFVLYSLHNYIDTDYCLIVQHDGWVLNANNFNPQWFRYDYIGAPTAFAVNGDSILTDFTWVPSGEKFNIVYNGGFSLRSMKLMEAPSRFGIVRHLKNPMSPTYNEDMQLCGFMRPALENIGIKFAPLDQALYFSFEHLAPNLNDQLDLTLVFGNHCKYRALRDYDIIEYDEENTEIPVINLLKKLGYRLEKKSQMHHDF